MFSALRRYLMREKRPARKSTGSNNPPYYSALIDSGTRAVLAVSYYAAAINFLSEAIMDTYNQLNVAVPNHTDGLPFPTDLPSYAEWSWNINARRFERTRPDIWTKALDEKSKLAVAKMNAATAIMWNISLSRMRLEAGVKMQDVVYLGKKLQAQAFRDRGYEDGTIFEFPYVFQHADIGNMSYREAADDIILRAKLDDDLLAKTEFLRMTYLRSLKAITDASEIAPLLEAFHRDAFKNAHV